VKAEVNPILFLKEAPPHVSAVSMFKRRLRYTEAMKVSQQIFAV
jgi:hypothetical protein